MSDLTEEQQNERDRLIVECMALGYLLNQRTEFAVFVNFSGHVDSCTVQICRSKTNYNEEVASTEFCTDGRFKNVNFSDPNGWMKSKRDLLIAILETRKIPYDQMIRTAHEVYSYHF